MGRVPKSRDDLDIERLLFNLEELGGDNIEVIDSNKVWEEEEFREKFPEDFTEGDHPPRILLFTTTTVLL